jgi:hypothetical protein
MRSRRHHNPEDLRRWLTTLAAQLQYIGSRDWQWWNLPAYTWPQPLKSTPAFQMAVGLACILTLGVTLGIFFGLIPGLWGGLIGALASLWVSRNKGPLLAVLRLGLEKFPTEAPPPHTVPRLRGESRHARRALKNALGSALLGGFVFSVLAFIWATFLVAIFAGMTIGLTIGIKAAGIVGLVATVIGLAYGPFWSFFEDAPHVERPTSVIDSYVGNRTLITVRSLTAGLGSGLILGLIVGLAFGLKSGIADGVTYGIYIGAGGGLMGGILSCLSTRPDEDSTSAWFWFHAAAWRERLRGNLPASWRVMSTLSDCHRLGLLREVGATYQFRHAALQDHLAPLVDE